MAHGHQLSLEPGVVPSPGDPAADGVQLTGEPPVSNRTLNDQLCDVILRDGSTLPLRPARQDDIGALVTFFAALSPESRYYRFFGVPNLDAARVAGLVPADRTRGAALVGECGGRIVAFAGYYSAADDPDRAEVAFAIADAFQGRGIGTRLLEQLATLARTQRIRSFDAYVRGDNLKMMDVFLESGYRVSRRIEGGVFHVELSLEATLEFAEKAARRSQLAATASMKGFFEPGTIAVVGANRERGRIGSEILHNLQSAGFTGTITPVHPTAKELQGLRAYPGVSDIPGTVDLAVIVVPAAQVLSVVEECISKGVRALCVISAGFGEAGAEGRAREIAILEKIRSAGCRLVGPNCMGLLNTDPAVRLNATFSPVYPPSGSVAMSTQSGALGLAILDYARRLNIGISSFVSVGNKIDVSGNDLIQYWAEDPHTSVIVLYLESFGNPKKFGEIARRVARVKPIVAVKAGRSTAGARAASSHTGALAASDTVVDALFHQAGVIRTNTLEELFDVAALLAHQPIPRGRRVAILTNAGGPGILAADACEANGLELVALTERTRVELRSFLPASASVANPVDMLASAPPEHYRRALAALIGDEQVDSILTIFIPPLVTNPEAVAAAIAGEAAGSAGKPIAAIFMRAEGAPPELSGIPSYAFPESAALALARVTAYGEWRQRPVGVIPDMNDVRADQARALVDLVLQRGGGWLTPIETQGLMRSVGINMASARMAKNADEAVAAAHAIGFPVVLKAIGPMLLHKTEHHAVRLNLDDESAVRHTALDFEERFRGELTGLLVQQMVTGGVEMLVGALHDPTFGPLVVCGSGGVLVDLLADPVFRIHPVTQEDAAEMIGEVRGSRLLRGYRGSPPADEGALRDVLLRVSALLSICPDIQELDLNPVKVLTAGACVVDARVRVERRAPQRQGRRIEY
jgi:acetyl coenzyme A synthetase (ADP forming)-like protein